MKDYDYEKEVKRIWALGEKDFIHECATKPLSIVPKYYLNLKEALMALVLGKFVESIQEHGYDWAIEDNISMMYKARAYVTHLSTMQKPPKPQFFKGDLNYIEETLNTLIKKRDADFGYLFNDHERPKDGDHDSFLVNAHGEYEEDEYIFNGCQRWA